MTILTRTTTTVESLPVPLTRTSPEPAHGAVLMLDSTSGTACQRFYSDGAYHAATGKVFERFEDLFETAGSRNDRAVFLLYVPE
jgi:hypothetical protein